MLRLEGWVVILSTLVSTAAWSRPVGATGASLGETPQRLMAYEDLDLVVDELPFEAGIDLAFAFNHANFVRGRDNSKWDLPAPRRGWSGLAAGLTLGYWLTRKARVGASISVHKPLAYDFASSDPLATSIHRTEIGDLTLSGSGYIGKLPRLKLEGAWSLAVDLPTSNNSRAAGLILRASPTLTVSRDVGPIEVALQGRYTWQELTHPTGTVDCRRVPETCRVFGDLLAVPRFRHRFGGSLRIAYSWSRWAFHASYGLSSSIGAAAYEKDELTSVHAQVGQQVSGLAHSFSLGVSRALFDALVISGSMSTSGPVHSDDGQRLTLPFFDLESNDSSRTIYGLIVSHSF